MILVTGASGNVGSNVVAGLLRKGEQVRAFSRNPGKLPQWSGPVEAATGDLGQPESWGSALKGVQSVFLMSNGPQGELFERFVAAARDAGGHRIVLLSTLAVNVPGSVIGAMHRKKEEAIRAAGVEGRFLRPGGFMSNAYRWIDSIQKQGVVHNPLGEGKTAPIAPEDIAAVAVAALVRPELTEEHLELTGAETLSLPEQVRQLSEILGRPLRVMEVDREAAVQSMVRDGFPEPIASAIADSYEEVRQGRYQSVKTDTVERITGGRPMSWAEWARAHRDRFASA